jgi:NAD(P)-dependent dehydrogenase (short-subunit alcohol dehydrogenase family)
VVGRGGGIGRAQHLGLADAGADVAVASHKLEHLQPVVKEIHGKGRKSLAVAVDVSQEKSVAAMVDTVLKQFPRIEILVNAHGISLRKPAVTSPIEDLHSGNPPCFK